MPIITKPSKPPLWATNPGVIVEPSDPKKQSGWVAEKPAFQHMNWIHNTNYLWQQYFDSYFETIGNVMTFDDGNNRIGIGTATPEANLHVPGVTNGEAIRFGNFGSMSLLGGGYPLFCSNAKSDGGGSTFRNILDDEDVGVTILSLNRNIGLSGPDALQHGGIFVRNGFATADNQFDFNSLIPALTWDTSNGNIGIGTHSPNQKLDVHGNLCVDGGNMLLVQNIAGSENISLRYNTGIPQLFSSDPIDIYTQSTFAMRIDGNQRVGIGTTSPNSRLSVEQYMSGTGELATLTTSGSSANQFIRALKINAQYAGTSSELYGLDIDLDKTDTGVRNIYGINIDAKQYRMSGAALADYYGIRSVVSANAATSTATNLRYYGGYFEGNSGASGEGSTIYGSYNKAIAPSSATAIGGYFTASGGGNNYGLIVGSGRVGIGTSTPGSLLTCAGIIKVEASDTQTNQGSNSTSSLVVQNTNGTTNNFSDISFFNQNNFVVGKISSKNINHAGNEGDLSFWTRPNGGGIAQRLTIKSDGKVGIGLTSFLSHSSKLHVFRDFVIGGENGANMYSRIHQNSSTLDLEIIANDLPANVGPLGILFRAGTPGGGGPNDLVYFKNDGNVGIGTKSPEAKLHIPGLSNGEAIRYGSFGSFSLTGGGYPLVCANAKSDGGSNTYENLLADASIGIAVLSLNRNTNLSAGDGPTHGGIFVRNGFATAGNQFNFSTLKPALTWSTQNGFIGIGLDKPERPLHIETNASDPSNGHILLTDNGDNRQASIYNVSGDLVMGTHETDDILDGYVKIFEGGDIHLVSPGARITAQQSGTIELLHTSNKEARVHSNTSQGKMRMFSDQVSSAVSGQWYPLFPSSLSSLGSRVSGMIFANLSSDGSSQTFAFSYSGKGIWFQVNTLTSASGSGSPIQIRQDDIATGSLQIRQVSGSNDLLTWSTIMGSTA